MGAELAVAARLALAAAFAWSAGMKLAHPAAFSAGLAAFGIPAPGTVARLLPPVEAAVAVVLLAVPDERWPAVAAIGLLAVFTAAVATNLLRGRRAPCPCFGVEAGRALSATTLARNAFLLVLAATGARSTDGAGVVASAVLTVLIAALTLTAVRRLG